MDPYFWFLATVSMVGILSSIFDWEFIFGDHRRSRNLVAAFGRTKARWITGIASTIAFIVAILAGLGIID